MNANYMFDGYFIEIKALYLHHFNTMPSLNFVNRINGEKAFIAFNERYASNILYMHKYRWYKHQRKKFEFDRTVIVLNNDCLVEFDTDQCKILHNGEQENFVNEVIALLLGCQEKQIRPPSEINLIVRTAEGLELKQVEIKRTKLNLDLFYEDDFKEVDGVIRNRLKQKNDKGIVLLHGLPGTGKTTYLRYLIGNIRKKVLFLSPNIAANLMNPEFIDLLIDNQNTVLIIEDAETILMDRKFTDNSSVSNLLNISDGLMADFLNVQLICTFNNSLTMVDSALMRKGRLIAKYEFGKLSISKSQKLSDHLGFKNVINKPMTVAEVANQNEREFKPKEVQVLGFRKQEIILEN
jgi:hypothetical protein